MSRQLRAGRAKTIALLLAAGIVVLSSPLAAQAASATQPSDFSLQVTPSPLVLTIKPGQTTETELKIRNAGSGTEELKIEPRTFSISSNSSNVKLNDTTPPDIATWINFSAPNFTVQAGEVFAEKIRFALPKATGFSYSFALVISRQNQPKPTAGGRLIQGSVAIFTLVNVDRPGATRRLEVATFAVKKHVYEYVPAELNVTLKNSGNTIVQPFGNIFIQRGSNDKTPLATLPVNEQRGYILPNTTRTIATSWGDGFPAYKTITETTGKTSQKLTWNWSKLSNFRIGRYTAKLVAVYDDGQGHDVPIQGEVSFWIFPWKILLGLFVVGLLVLFGLYSFVKKIISLFKKATGRKKSAPPTTSPPAAKE